MRCGVVARSQTAVNLHQYRPPKRANRIRGQERASLGHGGAWPGLVEREDVGLMPVAWLERVRAGMSKDGAVEPVRCFAGDNFVCEVCHAFKHPSRLIDVVADDVERGGAR